MKCEEKRVWVTLFAAECAAKARSSVRFDKKQYDFTAYKCPECGMFHITSNKKQKG